MGNNTNCSKILSWLPYFFLGLAILAFDIWTKKLTNAHFPLPQEQFSYPVKMPALIVGKFLGIELQITHAINSGAAWSIFEDFPRLLVALRIILVLALLMFLFYYNKRPNWRMPLILIISGAVGNLIDYFVYGYVIDMIHFRFWGYDYPVFNVADICIFLGSVWIMLSAFTESSKGEQCK